VPSRLCVGGCVRDHLLVYSICVTSFLPLLSASLLSSLPSVDASLLLCRKLLRKDDIGWEETLLPLARQVALKRVVVKRPKKASSGEGVSFSYRSRQTRYEVYVSASSSGSSGVELASESDSEEGR
jgi:Putative SAM-dependent methyltransferase